MKRFLIKHGVVKTDQQANYVLIAIIILCFIFIFSQLGGNSSNRNTDTFDESDEFMNDGMMLPGEVDTTTNAEIELAQ